MLTLRLFGGLSLTDSEGVVPARATQPRRLALLAIVAVGADRPTSRDKLLGLLWPNADHDHARHLLSDSLYVLRDAFGEDLFRIAGEFVSLDPARVSSDVGEFRRAIDAGDMVGAADAHGARGALLDGVHLVDSVEFERWVDVERDRLSTDYQRVLEQLAGDAVRSGDLNAAVTWRRRLAVEAPLSSRAALALMRALADAGDPSGAVAFARAHTALVREELDCPADPRVAALAGELRSRPAISATVEDASLATTPTARASERSSIAIASASAARRGSRPLRPRLRVAFAAGALSLALMAGDALAWRRSGSPAASAAVASSVAIVPFATTGADPVQKAIAKGVTESLDHFLATTRGTRVVTATPVEEALLPKELRRIGEQLHVAQVIAGSVQSYGERMRVRVRLVDANTAYVRWSGSYESESQDVLALEEDVGRAVAGALSIPLAADAGAVRARQGTSNLEAYDLYLRGRHEIELRSDTGFRAAVNSYSAAIALDPRFAAAYAGLAEAYSLTAFMDDYEYRGPRETARLAEAAALTAIALDDSLAESHLALGIVRMIGPIDFARSESELRRALALDPRDRRTRSYLSKLYAWSERPDAALREARRLVDEDPLSTPALRELARALLVSRRYDEALAQLDRARTLGPPMRMAPQLAGEIYAARAMYPQAIAVLRTRNEPLTRALLGYALARAGDTSSARRVLDGFVSRWRHGNGSAMDIAIVHLGLGDLDRVFEWLDRALDECSIRGIIMEPLFDDLRADPRFAPVRGRLLGAVHRASSGARADLDSPRGRDARSRTTNGHRSGSRW